MSEELTAYCMKCKTKRPLKDAQPEYTSSGSPATRGVCPVCGTSLYRMGETDAHADIPKPKIEPKKTSKKSSEPRRRGNLVIVESPAKARTIEHYLGKNHTVKASVGHVRDLLKSRLSVDVEHDFEPEYRVPNDKRQVVKDLRKAAERAKDIYIATDPDREGEAIAWHLIAAAEIPLERVHRVVFHEITKEAVQRAFEHPRAIDMSLVDAQQARRILDRLVGYELSPLLWEKVRPRLSAGRVQSVAVRLVVDRERAIDAFVPEEYWTIDAQLAREEDRADKNRISFTARLAKIRGEDFELPNEAAVQPILSDLENAEWTVDSVKYSERRRNPLAPFTTSTMQQEASRRINFTSRRTMSVAQRLYEGVDLGNGESVGLITYMRTDSTNVAAQAQQEAAQYIKDNFGAEYIPEETPEYQTKTKGAQEAHEAIRPTSVFRTPETLKQHLKRDELRLYTLIWQRFVSSQMAPAVYDTIRVEVLAGAAGGTNGDKPYLFRASGSSLRFAGFLAVYADYNDEDNPADEDLDRQFPNLSEDDLLDLLNLLPEQHFTQPPPRYSEATLVKEMEEYGIGRPSTYAPIIQTIQQRGYVEREGKRLKPTETGEIVNDVLVKYFQGIVDVNFTAQMEEDLDSIASGERDWVPVLRDFYTPFSSELEHARKHAPSIDMTEEVGRPCPECGQGDLVIRWGRYGKFIGCSRFPECRYTEPWLEKLGIHCPECADGELVERKTRRGRTFYGCSNYPECEWTSWKRPLPDPCPECGGLLIVQDKEWAKCTSCEEQVRLDSLPSSEKEPA